MARCSYCAAETQLYVNSSPVCVACSEQHDPVRKPPGTSGDSLAVTNLSLAAAREAYSRALEEASRAQRDFDPADPGRDAALHNANRQLESASARYQEALRDFIATTGMRRGSG